MKNSGIALAIFMLFSPVGYADIVKKYSIGTQDINYFPYFGKNDEMKRGKRNFIQDVIDAFSADKNISFEMEYYPVKRLDVVYLKAGTLDFRYPDSPSWNVNSDHEQIYYSDPICDFIDATFVHEDNVNMGIEKVRVIGIIDSYIAEPYIEKIIDKSILVHEYRNSTFLLKALALKRIDAAYINEVIGNKILSKNQLHIEQSEILPKIQSSYRLSSIKHPKLIKQLNTFLSANIAFIEKVKLKHGLCNNK